MDRFTANYWRQVLDESQRAKGLQLRQVAVTEASKEAAQRRRQKTLALRTKRRQRKEQREARLQRLLHKLSGELDLVRESRNQNGKGKPR